jgi:hypothetical protein
MNVREAERIQVLSQSPLSMLQSSEKTDLAYIYHRMLNKMSSLSKLRGSGLASRRDKRLYFLLGIQKPCDHLYLLFSVCPCMYKLI